MTATPSTTRVTTPGELGVPDGVTDGVGVAVGVPVGDVLEVVLEVGDGLTLRAALGDGVALLDAGVGAGRVVFPAGGAVRRTLREARSGASPRVLVGTGVEVGVASVPASWGTAAADGTGCPPSARVVANTAVAATAAAPVVTARAPRRRGALCLPIRAVSQPAAAVRKPRDGSRGRGHARRVAAWTG